MSELKPCPFCGSTNVELRSRKERNMSDLIEDNRCAKCRWHSEDHLFCENPNSDFYGWFRNDWKRCDKYEEREVQE